jgi:hypothetical protein
VRTTFAPAASSVIRLPRLARACCDRRLRPWEGVTADCSGACENAFRRAIDRSNLLVAEAPARQLSQLTLEEALELYVPDALFDRR